MGTATRFVAKNGLDNNSKTIINVLDPVNAQDASTKAYSTNATNLVTGTVAAARLPAFTGDATSTAGTSVLTLANSGVSAGTYGNATTIPVVTVDIKGRVTAVSTAAVTAGSSSFASQTDVAITSVANGDIITYNSATSKYVNSNTIDGGTY